MKTFVMAAVAASMLVAGSARAQGKQDFVLTNRTGYEIAEVYVSPSRAGDWEEDVLGQDTLDDGQHVKITFPRRAHACNYDLKVVYSDKDKAQWGGLDLCSVSRVTLHYSRNQNKTWITTD